MALGDIGMFLPSESQYARPGTYDKALQAEASKRATWLAQMDQFYANLGEAERQFNETLQFKTTTRDLELAFAREKLDKTLELQEKQLEQQSSYQNSLIGLKARELNLQEEKWEDTYDLEKLKLERELGGPSPSERWNAYEQQAKANEAYRNRFLDILQKNYKKDNQIQTGPVVITQEQPNRPRVGGSTLPETPFVDWSASPGEPGYFDWQPSENGWSSGDLPEEENDPWGLGGPPDIG